MSCMTCGGFIGVDHCPICFIQICLYCSFRAIDEDHYDNCKLS